MAQQVEAFIAVAALLTGLFLFVHGMTIEGGHIMALGGLALYLAVWTYGIFRASYS